jgi:hypothetical protein
VWRAWQGGFFTRLEEAKILALETGYTEYPVEGEFVDIRSIYVCDLRRYESIGTFGWEDEDALAGVLTSESVVQFGFVPRDIGRLRRWRWRRKARRHAMGRP